MSISRKDLNAKLLQAALKGTADQVRTLLAANADVDTTYDPHNYLNDQTPLLKAAYARNISVVSALLHAKADAHKHLGPIVLSNDIPSVKYVLDTKADVNAGIIPPLHRAVGNHSYFGGHNGFSSIVLMLLARKADVNQEADQTRPLLIAAKNDFNAAGNQPNIISMLIKAGAEINATNGWDSTALLEAAKAGNSDCMRLLIEAKANIQHVDHLNRTALHYTVARENMYATQLLVDAKADLHPKKDVYGKTLLHYAQACTSDQMIHYLNYAEARRMGNVVDNLLVKPAYKLAYQIRGQVQSEQLNYAKQNLEIINRSEFPEFIEIIKSLENCEDRFSWILSRIQQSSFLNASPNSQLQELLCFLDYISPERRLFLINTLYSQEQLSKLISENLVSIAKKLSPQDCFILMESYLLQFRDGNFSYREICMLSLALQRAFPELYCDQAENFPQLLSQLEIIRKYLGRENTKSDTEQAAKKSSQKAEAQVVTTQTSIKTEVPVDSRPLTPCPSLQPLTIVQGHDVSASESNGSDDRKKTATAKQWVAEFAGEEAKNKAEVDRWAKEFAVQSASKEKEQIRESIRWAAELLQQWEKQKADAQAEVKRKATSSPAKSGMFAKKDDQDQPDPQKVIDESLQELGIDRRLQRVSPPRDEAIRQGQHLASIITLPAGCHLSRL